MKRHLAIIFILTILINLMPFSTSYGYEIEKIADQEILNDFIVGPGKTDVELRPGESTVVNIIVTNRLGTTKTFEISTEDFKGSEDANEAIVLVEGQEGPYSLKNYIKYDQPRFTIEHGEQAIVPVTVSVPSDANPGGLYGSVMISTVNDSQMANASVVSRIGSLLFVRVAGEVVHDLSLNDFEYGNDRFQILYENKGTVHENPQGKILVKNLFGKEIANIELEPWFVLPNSLRVREVSFPNDSLFGVYSAELQIDKGNGEFDTSKISFWVISWQVVLFVLIALIIIVGIWLIVSRRRSSLVVFLILISGLIYSGQITLAQVMTSGTYKIQSDSINFSGGRSDSATYVMENTAGEIATGESASATYKIKAGYQQMNSIILSMTAVADVVMSPDINVTGGTSNGSTNFTVTTDNPTGYRVTIKASDDPAMQSSLDIIDDFASTAANPSFNFSVAAADSRFAYSPEGQDIASTFKDDGAACNSGVSDTADACWAGLSTTDATIVNRTSDNMPGGTSTTLKMRVGVDTARDQEPGVYHATTTLTLIPL